VGLAQLGGFRTFVGTRSGDKVAPIPDLPAKSTKQFEKRQRSHDTPSRG